MRSRLAPALTCGLLWPLTAGAEPGPPPTAPVPMVEAPRPTIGRASADVIEIGDPRGAAEEFLVLPEGADLGADLRTITADGGLGPTKLKLTDLALFDAHLSWAFAAHYELDASLAILAKQPSATREDIVQGGSLTVRRDLPHSSALALSGAVAPLLDLGGLATGGAMFVTHKKRLNEIVTFAMAGGANAVVVRAAHAMDTPYVVEGAAHGAVLVRIPNGVWGGWLGAGYAIPAVHHGHDPVSGMALDPQPRLDIDIGTTVMLDRDWDLSADLMILDRGDLANPATRLPVLDGGFDQIQIMVSVSRRIHADEHRRGISDPLIQL